MTWRYVTLHYITWRYITLHSITAYCSICVLHSAVCITLPHCSMLYGVSPYSMLQYAVCVATRYITLACYKMQCVLHSHSAVCNPPKMREIPLWSSTNGAIAYFLVLPGSLLSSTEITAHIYFSPLKPSRELNHKSGLHMVWGGYD